MSGLNFYKSRGRHLVRTSNPVSRQRVATEAAFARTRENAAEFATASRAAKLLRRALCKQLIHTRDARVANRLAALFLSITKTDPVSDRGQRHPANGNLHLLQHFCFNQFTPLAQRFIPPITPHINRETGIFQTALPAFIPNQHIEYPPGATHYQLFCAAVALDFTAQKSVTATTETPFLELNHEPVQPQTLTCTLTPNSQLPLVLVMGIVFTQMVNGVEYPFSNKSYNTMQVVQVSHPKAG